MCVEEEGQFRTSLWQQRDDVILQDLGCPAAPWTPRVPETSEVYELDFEFVDGEEVCDFTEPARMLSKAMDDCNGTFRISRGVLGVIEPDIGQFGGQVLLPDSVILLLKLA